MSGENYAESIARMKQEAALRQQHQLVREAQALHQEVQEYEQAAAEALAAGDTDGANHLVETLQEREQELAHVAERLPPPPPQIDPRLAQFAQRNQAFLQRYGQRAYEALDAAHQYLLRPRNPNSNDPRYTGAGFSAQAVYSPQYFKALKDLMELHGQELFGVKYDRSEQSLTPNQAAKISGFTPAHYNYGVRMMHAQGRLGQKR
jgi:ATP/maltotriose-dependent transcriptional regulator MalT